jgi:hypothetical protein
MVMRFKNDIMRDRYDPQGDGFLGVTRTMMYLGS